MTSSRTAKSILNRIVMRSRQPVLLFDPECRIVFANEMAESLLGMNIEQLSESVCRYAESNPTTDNHPLGALCPPPEIFDSGQPRRASIPSALLQLENPMGDASSEMAPLEKETQWTIHFCPLVEENRIHVLAVLRDNFHSDEQTNELSERMRELLRQAQAFWSEHFQLEQFVGQSEASQQILVKSRAATASGANMVIFGPPGSGREYLARAIHQTASAENPQSNTESEALLIPLEGSIADPELVQSTFKDLFDMQRTLSQQTGRLLLLNADRLSSAAQTELLGLLKLRNFDIRISSTSSRSLIRMEGDTSFDRSLASMLSTVEIEVPPLSDRIEDIPVLAQVFVERGNRLSSKQLGGFSEEALECLIQYSWPGNANELMEMIEEIRPAIDGNIIGRDDLPRKIHLALSADRYSRKEQAPVDLDQILKEVETEMIQRAMKMCKGNKTKAAQLLGINRARLIRRLDDQVEFREVTDDEE